ncbi:MAG: hypothetical protein IMZ57_04130, partial [Acidobacteria bacterium]|nr:hypothetical protein [Acidobacteriota bacterium]
MQIAREQVGIPAPAPKKTPLQLAREQTGIPAPAKPDGIGEVAKAAAKAAKNPAAKSWLGTMLSGVADVVQHPVENVAKPFAAGAVSTGKALIDTNVRMGKQLTGSSALPGPLGAENQLAELSKTASAASEYVGGPKLPATPRPLYNTVRWGQEHVGEPIHKWASDKLKDWQESHPEWSAGQVESLGDVLNPSKLTRSMAASAPYMIASGAAMAAGHPEVAFAIVFGAEGQPAYEEAVKAGASEEQANATANVVGLVNGAIEMAKVGQIVKFIGGGDKVLAKTATQIAKNALKKAPQSVTKEFIKTVASNALEEASQQVTSELTPNVIYGKPIEPGFWERQLTSGVVGGIQAGLFAGAPRLGMAGLSKVAGKPPEAATPPQTPAVPPKAPTPPQTAAAPSLAPDATLAAGVAPAKPTVPTGAVVTTPPPPTVHEEVKDVAMKGYMAAAEAVANAKIALDDATVAETAKAAQDTLTAARAKLDAAAKFVTAADKVAQSAQTAQTAQAEPAATENVPRGTIPAETPAPTVKEPLSVAPAPAKRVTELTPPETAAPVAAPKPAA